MSISSKRSNNFFAYPKYQQKKPINEDVKNLNSKTSNNNSNKSASNNNKSSGIEETKYKMDVFVPSSTNENITQVIVLPEK